MNWGELIGEKKHYSDIPEDLKKNIKTERQWAKLGYVPISNTCGILLYANRFRANQFKYFHESEVRKGTQEELDAYFAEERLHRREAGKRYRARKAEEQIQEAKRLREKLTDAYGVAGMRYEELIWGGSCFRELCQLYSAVADPVVGYDAVRNIVLDTETTGLMENDELLQVSILDADTGTVLFNSYIQPCFHLVWPDAQTVNDITYEMVEDAPHIYKVLPVLNAIFRNVESVIGYDLYFDILFLKRAGVKIPDNVVYHDVKDTFAVVYGDYNNQYHNFTWKSLSLCAEVLGYDWGTDTAHDSLADCKATLFCYNELEKSEYVAKYEENLRLTEREEETME